MKINRPDPLDSGSGVTYIEGVNNATRTADLLDSMSPAQHAYLLARAAYDAAIAESNRRTSGMPSATDEEFEIWNDACETAHTDLGMDRLSDLLAAAEDALLAWSFGVARKEAGRSKAKLALIASIEAGICKPQHLLTRNKTIDMALRLCA